MKTKKELYKEFCEYKDNKNRKRIATFDTLNRVFGDQVGLQQEMLFWAYKKGKHDSITGEGVK